MHHHGGAPSMAVPVAFVLIGALAYLLLAIRQHASPRGWSWWRTSAFLAGTGVLILGLLSHLLPFPEGDLRKHMLQHLLLGMFAPIGLVMAAPITLLLRTLPVRYGRMVTRLLHSRFVRILANPIVALTLDLGGMAVLYFTPLYLLMMSNPALHYAVHFHFVAAGCLYTWVIAGPDPAPRRLSVPMRLVVLGLAVVIHSVLAQMLYAGAFVKIPTPAAQLQRSAELMYYGGDISEMLLAFALVTTWRPVRRNASALRSGPMSFRLGPEKTHTESCRAAASFFCAARLGSNSAGGR
jgi:putative membrane protein